MPSYNPFTGGFVTTQNPNGANPSTAVPASVVGVLGSGTPSFDTSGKTHWTVGGIVLGAILIVAFVHFAGFRTHVTVGAGD